MKFTFSLKHHHSKTTDSHTVNQHSLPAVPDNGDVAMQDKNPPTDKQLHTSGVCVEVCVQG